MSETVTNEWMQEYERLLQAYKGAIINYYAVPDYYSGPDMAEARRALDAHTRLLVRENDELRAEVERLRVGLRKANAGFEEYERRWYLATDEIEELRALLDECADDIEAEAEDRWGYPDIHPAQLHKFDRDMDIVHRVRAALAMTTMNKLYPKGERTWD